jgi:hypothetical protein
MDVRDVIVACAYWLLQANGIVKPNCSIENGSSHEDCGKDRDLLQVSHKNRFFFT